MSDAGAGGTGEAAAPVLGTVDARVQTEFPGLELRWCRADRAGARRSRAQAARLRALADRTRGGGVVALRTKPVAHAYRAFYRQIGLDPDVTRIPSEAVAVERLLRGGYPSRDPIHDACLIALVETGVPVWALDAARVAPGGLGIRAAEPGERMGSRELGSGVLVVADSERALGVLFGPLAEGHAPGPRTSAVVLFTVGVEGVPAIHLEEALWMSAEALRET